MELLVNLIVVINRLSDPRRTVGTGRYQLPSCGKEDFESFSLSNKPLGTDGPRRISRG